MEKKKTQYILKGIVHPERGTLTIKPSVIREVIHASTGNQLTLEFSVHYNQITIYIETEDDWNIFDLRNIARNYAIIICTTVAFVSGHFFEIEIVQILSKEKQIDEIFGNFVPCISERVVPELFEQKLSDMINLSAKPYSIYFNRCFKDLNSALKDSEDTAFYCYRAIESLRQYCKDRFSIGNKEEQWAEVWRISGYTRKYIEKIETNGHDIRHGNYNISNETDRKEYLTKTWDIVEGFIMNLP